MKRVFITGASGCVGHYICEHLIDKTDHELFLLVRNPAKLGFNCQARPGIHVLPGNLHQIDDHAELLQTIDVAILTAAAWGDPEQTRQVNVVKTHRLMELLAVDRCEQVIYFSTASILNRQNQLLPEAGEIGTDYIRTKYQGYQQLDRLAIAPKITTLFPTLVFGGSSHKPYSHITAGIPQVLRWAELIRWFQGDASFHFIHAQDIAQIVGYLVEHPGQGKRNFVMGNPAININEAIAEVCTYLNKKIYFQLPLSTPLANFFIVLFRIQMATWDYFSLQYRHFTYQNVVMPSSFGLDNYCPTLTDLLKLYQNLDTQDDIHKSS